MCSSYFSVRSANESHLQDAVARVGPISVAINASEKSLRVHIYTLHNCASYVHVHIYLILAKYCNPILIMYHVIRTI